MDADDLRVKLDDLAIKMMEDASKDGVSLPHRIDVFKTCSQHYVNIAKVKGGGKAPDGEGMTMGSLRERVSGTGETDESPSASE